MDINPYTKRAESFFKQPDLVRTISSLYSVMLSFNENLDIKMKNLNGDWMTHVDPEILDDLTCCVTAIFHHLVPDKEKRLEYLNGDYWYEVAQDLRKEAVSEWLGKLHEFKNSKEAVYLSPDEYESLTRLFRWYEFDVSKYDKSLRKFVLTPEDIDFYIQILEEPLS